MTGTYSSFKLNLAVVRHDVGLVLLALPVIETGIQDEATVKGITTSLKQDAFA